jgi:hypothetical protein
LQKSIFQGKTSKKQVPGSPDLILLLFAEFISVVFYFQKFRLVYYYQFCIKISLVVSYHFFPYKNDFSPFPEMRFLNWDKSPLPTQKLYSLQMSQFYYLQKWMQEMKLGRELGIDCPLLRRLNNEMSQQCAQLDLRLVLLWVVVGIDFVIEDFLVNRESCKILWLEFFWSKNFLTWGFLIKFLNWKFFVVKNFLY